MRMVVGFIVVWRMLVDYLLMLGTNRMTDGRLNGRLIPAVVLGGVYTWLCLQPELWFLGNDAWRWLILILAGLMAFGWCDGSWHRLCIYWMLSLAVEDLVTTGRWQTLLPGAVAIWALSRLCKETQEGEAQTRLPLEIRHGKETVKLTALCDTGNTLRDPITGEQVLVIGSTAAEKLTGLTSEQLRKPLDTLVKGTVPGLRLIPYRALGQPGGLLLALRFRDVKLGNKHTDAIIALAPDRIGGGEGFQALAGGVI